MTDHTTDPLIENLTQELHAQGNRWDQHPKLYYVFSDRLEELRFPEAMRRMVWENGLHPRHAMKNLVDTFAYPQVQRQYGGNTQKMTGMAMYFEAYSLQGTRPPVGDFSQMEGSVEQRLMVAYRPRDGFHMVTQNRGGQPQPSVGVVTPGKSAPSMLHELSRLTKLMMAPPPTFRA